MRIVTSTIAEDTAEVMHMSRLCTALVHKKKKCEVFISTSRYKKVHTLLRVYALA
jgi:hypothetical protein